MDISVQKKLGRQTKRNKGKEKKRRGKEGVGLIMENFIVWIRRKLKENKRKIEYTNSK